MSVAHTPVGVLGSTMYSAFTPSVAQSLLQLLAILVSPNAAHVGCAAGLLQYPLRDADGVLGGAPAMYCTFGILTISPKSGWCFSSSKIAFPATSSYLSINVWSTSAEMSSSGLPIPNKAILPKEIGTAEQQVLQRKLLDSKV